MNQVLIIAWREVDRIRRRFGGNTSPLVALLFLVVLGVSAFVLQDTVTLGSGLYQIGVTGDQPSIQDSRFIARAPDHHVRTPGGGIQIDASTTGWDRAPGHAVRESRPQKVYAAAPARQGDQAAAFSQGERDSRLPRRRGHGLQYRQVQPGARLRP